MPNRPGNVLYSQYNKETVEYFLGEDYCGELNSPNTLFDFRQTPNEFSLNLINAITKKNVQLLNKSIELMFHSICIWAVRRAGGQIIVARIKIVLNRAKHICKPI